MLSMAMMPLDARYPEKKHIGKRVKTLMQIILHQASLSMPLVKIRRRAITVTVTVTVTAIAIAIATGVPVVMLIRQRR